MSDENLAVPPRVGDLGPEYVTLEAELVGKDAEREIDKAVRGRRGIARKYVRWVRRRNPDATPPRSSACWSTTTSPRSASRVRPSRWAASRVRSVSP
jgi:hypothetical protein